MALKPLKVAQLEAQFGKFSYQPHPTAAGQIVPDPAWAGANIASQSIPMLNGVATYGGTFKGKVSCHKLVAPFLKAAFEDIERHGLRSRIIYWGGSYVPRHQNHNPHKPLSSHSWGVAIDLNPQWNGYGVRPPAIGETGSVRELAPIFARYGFCWGGDWSTPDAMHFEFCDLSLLQAATAPKPLLLTIDGTAHEQVPLNRESDNRYWTIAGPLADALGRPLTASERELRVPLRVIAELSGYSVKHAKDESGERIMLAKL